MTTTQILVIGILGGLGIAALIAVGIFAYAVYNQRKYNKIQLPSIHGDISVLPDSDAVDSVFTKSDKKLEDSFATRIDSDYAFETVEDTSLDAIKLPELSDTTMGGGTNSISEEPSVQVESEISLPAAPSYVQEQEQAIDEDVVEVEPLDEVSVEYEEELIDSVAPDLTADEVVEENRLMTLDNESEEKESSKKKHKRGRQEVWSRLKSRKAKSEAEEILDDLVSEEDEGPVVEEALPAIIEEIVPVPEAVAEGVIAENKPEPKSVFSRAKRVKVDKISNNESSVEKVSVQEYVGKRRKPE